MLLGLVSTDTSFAASSPAPSVQAAQATQEDKRFAAQEIGVLATPELLILTDRNFVFALWERAKGTEVRASAQLAYGGDLSQSTQWIKTGIYQANALDQANKKRDDDAAKAAQEAKEKAALVIGITATPELWMLNDKEFAFAIYQRASGPKVKAAALAAYNGSAADQQAFILTGISTAWAQDRQDAIDADTATSEEQKRVLKAQAARRRAGAVVAMEPTAGQLIEPDRNFVLDLYNAAKPGSEIAAAALRAARSTDPAARTRYIETGIHEADEKDWNTWLKKKADADRRLVFELRTRAEQSGVHPALVTAADTALAGSDDDVDVFLRLGQYEDAVLTQSLGSTSPGTQGWYIRGEIDAVIGPGAGADATWRVVPGKADQLCHSFESVTHPEHYLRQQDLKVVVAPSDGTDRFRADATWCTKPSPDGGGVSLESFTQRGRLLRHYSGRLWAADQSGRHDYDTPASYGPDVTWRATGPTTR
ncbi:hypothetical protein GCM10023192_18300 [Amycolatopsis samaneae]